MGSLPVWAERGLHVTRSPLRATLLNARAQACTRSLSTVARLECAIMGEKNTFFLYVPEDVLKGHAGKNRFCIDSVTFLHFTCLKIT